MPGPADEQPLDWWPRMLLEALQPLSQGQPAVSRRYDGDARSRGDEEWAHLLALTIWVETPREQRRSRALQRDGDAALALWEQWMAEEDDYVARDRPDIRADVVDGGSQR